MSARELVETALHILTAWNSGRKPLPNDVDILRTAFPSLGHLAEDELACRVVNDLAGRLVNETARETEPQTATERQVA